MAEKIGPDYPIAIYLVASRYLIYDINHVSDLRARHRIPGVLTGSLPQAPQQNIFLGLPLELSPEEARFLVDDGLVYVVEDAPAHMTNLKSMSQERQIEVCEFYSRIGQAKADEIAALSEERSQRAMPSAREREQRALERNEKKKQKRALHDTVTNDTAHASSAVLVDETTTISGTSLFPSEPDLTKSTPAPPATSVAAYHFTPVTSTDILPPNEPHTVYRAESISVPVSYDVFKYLHCHPNGYFLSPGLRFGCNYLVYPGDPLRFHSHFLANGYQWDEEIDLMDLIGGGRLGTGVKKGFLLGGKEPNREGESGADGNVRCFCIEWAGL